jgi:hypothetical protein
VYEQRLTPQAQARLLRPIQELEHLLCQLAASINVDVMPGSGDPANFVLPQQPFNPCLFPKYCSFCLSLSPPLQGNTRAFVSLRPSRHPFVHLQGEPLCHILCCDQSLPLPRGGPLVLEPPPRE